MKRRVLLRKLQRGGCVLLRSGGNHDIYLNPRNGKKQPVPRHSEIDEHPVQHIMQYLDSELHDR